MSPVQLLLYSLAHCKCSRDSHTARTWLVLMLQMPRSNKASLSLKGLLSGVDPRVTFQVPWLNKASLADRALEGFRPVWCWCFKCPDRTKPWLKTEHSKVDITFLTKVASMRPISRMATNAHIQVTFRRKYFVTHPTLLPCFLVQSHYFPTKDMNK